MTTTIGKNTFEDYTHDKVQFLSGHDFREEVSYAYGGDVLSKRYVRDDGRIFYESLLTELTQYIKTRYMNNVHGVGTKRISRLEWWSDDAPVSKFAHYTEEFGSN